jgi:hypothetical protein
LKGGTRKIDKEERNRRKNEGERAREKNMTRRQVKAMRPFHRYLGKGEEVKKDAIVHGM